MTVIGTLLSSVGRLARWVTDLIRRITRRAGAVSRGAASRLIDRWRGDGVYRRTLIAAMSAITATLLPHPAAGAAVGALLSERARPHPVRHLDGFDDDEDDDDPGSTLGPAFRTASPFGRRPTTWDPLD